MPTQIVRVVNTGDKPMKFKFNADIYDLSPGKSVPVPFEVAAYWFGDPRVQDIRPGDRTRADFYDKKRAFWSFALGFDVNTEEERENHPRRDEISSWETKIPKFEVWSFDENPQRIYMLIEDPDGSKANPSLGQHVITSEGGLERRVQELESLLAETLNTLRAQQAAVAVATSATAITTPEGDSISASDVESVIPDPDLPSVGVTDQPVPVAAEDSGAKVDAPRSVPTGQRAGKQR